MTRQLLTFSFLLIMATTHAQNWQYSGWGFNLGAQTDQYQNMDYSMIQSFAKNPLEIERDLEGFEERANVY
ncbi:MAG: hypothetical protein AAF193_12590, partial [Bacteroidota bacterium]